MQDWAFLCFLYVRIMAWVQTIIHTFAFYLLGDLKEKIEQISQSDSLLFAWVLIV